MSDSASELILVCRMGGVLCGFPLASVAETMRPLPTESLPGIPDFVAGVSIIRGAAVPVVSGDYLMGDRRLPPTRFVLLRVGARQVALGVDEVVGIAPIEPARLADMPALAGGAGPAMSRLGALDGELLLVLDSARIIPDDVLELFETHRLAS